MLLANWIDPFAPAKGPPPRTLAAFFRWALDGAWPALSAASVTSIVAGTVEVSAALILGAVIDAAIAAGSGGMFAGNLPVLLLALGFFILLRPLVFGIFAYLQSIVIGPSIYNLTLSRLHRWTLGQGVSYFDDDFAGRIAQKEMQTARALTDVVIDVIHTAMFALASVVAASLMLTVIDWRVAAVLVLWLVGYLFLIRYFLTRVRAKSAARAEARAMVTGQIVDTVTNIKTVKLFAHADHEDRAALAAMTTLRQKALAFGRISVQFRFWLVTLAGLLPVLLIGGTLILWNGGTVSAGDIAATGALSLRLSQMTGWVSFTLLGLYANMGEIENGIHTLTPPYALVDAPGAKPLRVTAGEITFNNISFAYGRETGGVSDVSLTVHPGEKLGIVGASGAGKSTLVALLMRLYDTEKGAILIDGQDVRDVTQESLRREISMVTQETAMFNRPARDNILYGHPGASEDAILAASKRAEAHEFVLELEDHRGRKGYDAHLGERGVKLSGGQRQRIALARAILKDAPLLVLDEATSALDSEVEASIQTALARVMEGKTVLAIAHRLSTLARMDRIIVLDAGRIVESGTHAALLARGGLYARYWERQSGGFIGSEEAAE